MMPSATPAPGRCVVTSWPSLTDTTGTTIDTSWEEWFASFDAPPRYHGDTRHPGWSAAVCDPPVRGAANVVAMSALVLDYDAGTTIDEAVALWSEHFGIGHTTRKHKPDAHRFRVILPLTRTVTPDDYPIVWRWAQKIVTGANQKIDVATKDLARFWYMPARTDHYETRRLDGAPIDPTPIIQAHRYDEHERTSAPSPASSDLERRASRYLARMAPAISGSRGHDALWAAALAMVRGFRLAAPVALRLLRDEYNPRCQPPWSERELLHKVNDAERDATTAPGYLADKLRPVAAPSVPVDPEPFDPNWQPPEVPPDHVDPPELEMPPPPAQAPRVAADWRAALALTPQGMVRKTFNNLVTILQHHPTYGENLSFDEMRLTPLLGDRAVTDADVGRIRCEVETHFGFGPSDADVRAALCVVSDARKFHPVRRYLESLTWDGVERIAQVVPDCLRAKNTPLAQAMVRKWFISAAARALQPGCKVDTSLVLVGRQAARKSTFFAILGGEWFADTHMDITDKDGKLQLHSAWIYEWAEIENVTTNRRASEVKAFASSQTDTFRPPFGRAVGVHKRSTVIVGTTNEGQFLDDPTGSRRFWVVRVGDAIDVSWVTDRRDQLWAEAVAAYRNEESWWLDEDAERAREDDAAEYQVEDPWEQPIAEWLDGPGKAGAVTVHRILADALKVPAAQETRGAEMRVAAVMRRLGWAASQRRVEGAKVRHWSRKGST